MVASISDKLTEDQLVQLIVELLAEELEREPDELLAELAGKGSQLPCSSVVMLDIFQAVEDATGVELPLDKETGRSLSSVRTFARRVLELADGG